MRRFARVVGFILLALSACLIGLAIASWPPEGLFFAAPYLFGFPGVLFAVVGAVLVWLGRPSARANPDRGTEG